jgi:phage terminase large subunit
MSTPSLLIDGEPEVIFEFDPERAQRKMRYWQATPNRFIKGFLRTDLWLKQREIVHSVFTHPRTSVKACHASGKTHVAAAIALAFLTRFTEAVVVSTAPTWPQVEKLLWGEIHKLIKQSLYPFPKPLTTEIKLGPRRYAYGVSTNVEKGDEGVKVQGIHAANVLIIVDEAPGVDPKILDALEAALSAGNAHILEIGNPTVPSGPFADTFGRHRKLWNTFTISAFDTPNLAGLTLADLYRMEKENPDELKNNVVPYLITRQWVLDTAKKFGENGMYYVSRVEGEFPEQSEDSLFSIRALENARDFKPGYLTADTLMTAPAGALLQGGLDVAGPGEADTVLVLRDGPNVVFKKAFHKPDPRGDVAAELLPFKEKLSNINVDTAGIGWYMYLHLNDLGIPCTPCNVGEREGVDLEKYINKKSQYYWGLGERVREGDIGGLDDEQIQQMSTIRYEHTSRGQVQIESKEDMVARGVPSPDEAEAVMLAFADDGLGVWDKL